MVSCSYNDENFKKSLDFVYCVEGGYSNHRNDRGGATNFGITQNSYNSYLKRNGLVPQSVKNITKEIADRIYYQDYWCASGANKIDDFAIALILFDSCVNHGVGIGKSLYKKSENNAEKFLNLRRQKYIAIVNHNPSQKVFLKGWMNRIDRLEKYIKNQKETR